MAATIQRQPFGELGSARLRNLVSAKNCQNAITDVLAASSKEKSHLKPSNTFSKPANTLNLINVSKKRSYEPTVFEDDSDVDTENIDPSVFSTKRSKHNDGTSTKPTTPDYFLKTDMTACTPLPTAPSSIGSKPASSEYQFPGGASTAPAGRSPKHKRIGLLSPKRSSMSPLYTRVNPPSFGGAKSSTFGLPFSLDEAIRGTVAANHKKSARKSSVEKVKQPNTWFFDIYEDTPDEEAATVMQHSTGLLDLSSDDELSLAKKKDDRDKENIPPPDHIQSTTAGNAPQAEQSLGGSKRRRSGPKGIEDMLVDDEHRIALGDLQTEDFYPEGLDASSVIIIPADDEDAETSQVPAMKNTHQDKESHAGADVVAKTQAADSDASPGFVIAEDIETL